MRDPFVYTFSVKALLKLLTRCGLNINTSGLMQQCARLLSLARQSSCIVNSLLDRSFKNLFRCYQDYIDYNLNLLNKLYDPLNEGFDVLLGTSSPVESSSLDHPSSRSFGTLACAAASGYKEKNKFSESRAWTTSSSV